MKLGSLDISGGLIFGGYDFECSILDFGTDSPGLIIGYKKTFSMRRMKCPMPRAAH